VLNDPNGVQNVRVAGPLLRMHFPSSLVAILRAGASWAHNLTAASRGPCNWDLELPTEQLRVFRQQTPECRNRTQFATVRAVWQTVRMTNQQPNQQRPQHREDYKVQKLVDRIESKLALQAKTAREASQTSSKN